MFHRDDLSATGGEPLPRFEMRLRHGIVKGDRDAQAIQSQNTPQMGNEFHVSEPRHLRPCTRTGWTIFDSHVCHGHRLDRYGFIRGVPDHGEKGAFKWQYMAPVGAGPFGEQHQPSAFLQPFAESPDVHAHATGAPLHENRPLKTRQGADARPPGDFRLGHERALHQASQYRDVQPRTVVRDQQGGTTREQGSDDSNIDPEYPAKARVIEPGYALSEGTADGRRHRLKGKQEKRPRERDKHAAQCPEQSEGPPVRTPCFRHYRTRGALRRARGGDRSARSPAPGRSSSEDVRSPRPGTPEPGRFAH